MEDVEHSDSTRDRLADPTGLVIPSSELSRGDEEESARHDTRHRTRQDAHRLNEHLNLGPYRLLRLLGQGGMGRVYLAMDTLLHREVAIKTLKRDVATTGSGHAKRRFLREARAAAAVHSDYIVPIYHVGEDDGVPYIVMPKLNGESLRSRIHRAPSLANDMLLRIARDVAEGLAVAHQAGLIHRDIKPENIWLDQKAGRASILDFGLAVAQVNDSRITNSGVVMGTPRYMSPEQALGKKVDFRSDLFSLGVVMYRIVAGSPPFVGDSVTATLIAVTQHDPPPLDQVKPGLSPNLVQLVAELLNKDRDKRPSSATVVVDRFANIAEQTADEQAVPSAAPKSRRWFPSNRVAIAVAACLLAIAAITIGALRDDQAPPDTTGFVSAEAAAATSLPQQDSQKGSPEQMHSDAHLTADFIRAGLASLDCRPTMVSAGEPMSPAATVSEPTPIDGIRSWTIELIQHYNAINHFACSRASNCFATGGWDDSIRLWQSDGKLNSILLGHEGPTVLQSFAPNGDYLATINIGVAKRRKPALRIWRVEDGTCVANVMLKDWPWCVAWSPDGQKIAFDEERGIYRIVWLAESRVVTCEVETEPNHFCVWTPDSKSLVIESANDPLIFDATSGHRIASLPMPAGMSHPTLGHLALSADGTRIAGAADNQIHLWNLPERRFERKISVDVAGIEMIAWHPSESILAVSGDQQQRRLVTTDAVTGKTLTSVESALAGKPTAWTNDGQEIMLKKYNLICFHQVDTKSSSDPNGNRINDKERWYRNLTRLSTDGRRLLSGDRVFDVHEGELITQRASVPGRLILIGPDDRWRIVEKNLRHFLVSSGTQSASQIALGAARPGTDYRASQSGEYLARISGDQVIVWDAIDRKQVVEWKLPAQVWSVEFSPDQQKLATLSADRRLRVYSIANKQTLVESANVSMSNVIASGSSSKESTNR